MTPSVSWPPATPTRWSMMLPKDVPAVRTARTAVEAWLEGMPRRLRDDARSVVTELVGNAVLHGQPPIMLKIERTSEGLRIDVADAGVQRPAYARAARTRGWGLRIVDAMADRWGIADDASRVWCVLERDSVDRPRSGEVHPQAMSSSMTPAHSVSIGALRPGKRKPYTRSIPKERQCSSIIPSWPTRSASTSPTRCSPACSSRRSADLKASCA
jgi:anti-sigma regulatory factor (Ser/Thr protein kinase)